ncbi:hypothetical protein [Bacillus sp. ISL-55]|uniref:hypothetical protein n=1 Tax=Bacillus sp. ISL-55 TaxID=2819134 RepID=UPI001BECEA88|nr:hypothetical protein [Bacillus sp. ISL-55]MBT2695708.1 hypothetical protein [Bacillus sp. ISL-55]
MIKKYLLSIGLIIFAFSSVPAGNAETATEFIETGEEVEVKESGPKIFIYETLDPWLTQDASDLYFKKYNARKSVEMEGPMPENVRVWIKEVKSIDRKYTHLITIYLPHEKVIVDGKKPMKTADKFTYAVNATQLPVCHDQEGMKDCVKLVESYHKVISK